MNYRNLTFLVAALLWVGTSAFAEVSALKDAGNGQVSITFTYKDDTATEMDVIGSFDNWTVPGEAMTKNAAGLWEKTITAATTDEIQYKFYNKGAWIADDKAPDQKDDGYGGHNGLIVVADILSGTIPMIPGTKATLVAGAPKKPGRPKMYFSTLTYLESDTAFSTASGLTNPDSSGIRAYSDWKFLGDFMPGMPGRVGITLADATQKWYVNPGTDPGTGGQNLAGGLLFSPFYYLNGNQQPQIDRFDVAVAFPWVNFETGYGNTPVPGHKSVLWETVSTNEVVNQGASTLTGAWWPGRAAPGVDHFPGSRALVAGSGFTRFALGKALQEVGDLTFDAGVMPGLIPALGGQYGALSWLSAEAYGWKLEAQYDLKTSVQYQSSTSSTPTDSTQYLTSPLRQDYVGGLEGYFLDGFHLVANGVISSYLEGTALQVSPMADRSAFRVVAGFDDYYQTISVNFGYAYRGLAGQLLYLKTADNDAILGAAQTQTVTGEGELKFGYWGDFRLMGAYTSPADNSTATDTTLSVRPGMVLNLKSAEVYPVVLSLYGQWVSTSGLTAVGTKVEFDTLSLWAKWDQTSASQTLSTLLAEATVARGWALQAGAGYRSGSAVTSSQTWAGVVGFRASVDAPAAKNPVFYAQLVANMDPYNQDGAPGQTSFDLTDFGPSNGAAGYAGKAALRAGVEWQF